MLPVASSQWAQTAFFLIKQFTTEKELGTISPHMQYERRWQLKERAFADSENHIQVLNMAHKNDATFKNQTEISPYLRTRKKSCKMYRGFQSMWSQEVTHADHTARVCTEFFQQAVFI